MFVLDRNRAIARPNSFQWTAGVTVALLPLKELGLGSNPRQSTNRLQVLAATYAPFKRWVQGSSPWRPTNFLYPISKLVVCISLTPRPGVFDSLIGYQVLWAVPRTARPYDAVMNVRKWVVKSRDCPAFCR